MSEDQFTDHRSLKKSTRRMSSPRESAADLRREAMIIDLQQVFIRASIVIRDVE